MEPTNITVLISQAKSQSYTCTCTGKPCKPKGGKEKKAKEETPEEKVMREEKEKLRKDTSDAKKVRLDHQLSMFSTRG